MNLKEFGLGGFMRQQFYYVDPPLVIFDRLIYWVYRD